MKAVCIRENNFCVDILPDNGKVDLTATPVQIGNQIINGVSGSDFIVYDDVTQTSSGVEVLKGTSWKVSLWRGDKFTYDGSAWTLNSVITKYNCMLSVGGKGTCGTVNAYNATTCSECGGALL